MSHVEDEKAENEPGNEQEKTEENEQYSSEKVLLLLSSYLTNIPELHLHLQRLNLTG